MMLTAATTPGARGRIATETSAGRLLLDSLCFRRLRGKGTAVLLNMY